MKCRCDHGHRADCLVRPPWGRADEQTRVFRLLGIPVLLTRRTVPAESPGRWKWGLWKLATRARSEITNMALRHEDRARHGELDGDI